MYRQYDGYPGGHGVELANLLDGMKIVNGISASEKATKLANGMDCLAAQVIASFKNGVGNIYLYPAKTRDCGEEYIYLITLVDGQINVTVHDCCNGEKPVFQGDVGRFKEFCDSH